MNKKIKKKCEIIILWVFVFICIVGIVYSSFNIINWKKDVDNNKEIIEEIKENINYDLENDSYKIDFDLLKELNSDTVAYLKVNGTNIDYIVVKGNDNSYYLNHNFEKVYNVAGWIFADYRNKFDDTDKNLIIYGHNIKDGSMFGTLKNILNNNWQENKENLEILLITEKGQYKYQVFSTYSIIPEDYYINTEFKNNADFNEFVKKLKSRSVYDYGIDISGDDKILTLSSCIGDGSKRVVLHAKLIEKD